MPAAVAVALVITRLPSSLTSTSPHLHTHTHTQRYVAIIYHTCIITDIFINGSPFRSHCRLTFSFVDLSGWHGNIKSHPDVTLRSVGVVIYSGGVGLSYTRIEIVAMATPPSLMATQSNVPESLTFDLSITRDPSVVTVTASV